MTVGIVGWPQETNRTLAAALRGLGVAARLLAPADAVEVLGPGDVAIARLDVLPTLDGIEPGLELLPGLGQRGVRVLNTAPALVAAHDKLATDSALAAAGIPRPRTWHVRPSETARLRPPLVLKPRFGSWGRDVFRCRDEDELAACLDEVAGRGWFRRTGAVGQELLPASTSDLRVIVAGGVAVGSAERVAARGEWRTNISLGGRLRAARPPAEALELAVQAAAAIGADLVGVDLLPLDPGFAVVELNGAVAFDHRYSLGSGVYEAVVEALGLESDAGDQRTRTGVPSGANA